MARLKLGTRWRALVGLRFLIWKNSLRRSGLALETFVTAALNLLAVLGSLVLALSLGKLFSRPWDEDGLEVLRICLHIAFAVMTLFAVVIPTFIGAGRRSGENAALLSFPVRRRTLFALAMTTALVSWPQLFLAPSWLVTAEKVIVRGPVPLVSGLGILVLFALSLVVWGSALLMVLEAFMRRRSARELIGIVAFTSLMAVALLPALVDTGTIGREELRLGRILVSEVVLPAAMLLPPAVAAEGMSSVAAGDHSSWPTALTLGAWILGGLLLAGFVHMNILLEPVSHSSGSRRRTPDAGLRARRVAPVSALIGLVPDTIAAVMAKELSYLRRSTPGKLVLLVSPLFVVMIALAVGKLSFVKHPLLGMDPAEYALYGVLLYAGLFSSNFLVNAFAWEGCGIKTYLMTPLPARHLLLGKNLAVVTYQLVVLVECVAVWSLVRGLPDVVVLLSGGLVFYCGLLVLMAGGNFVSVAYPVKRSIAAVTNSASNLGTLVSFASVGVSAGLVLGALLLGMAVGGGLLQLVFLAVLVLALAVLNRVLLGPAADLLEERMEGLVEAVQ